MVDVDWSQLPEDLLRRIVEHYLNTHVEEFIIFSSVCHSWRHVAYGCDKSKLRNSWSHQMPWLLLTDGNDIDICSSRSFGNHFRTDSYFKDRDYSDEDHIILSDQDEILDVEVDTIMSDQDEILDVEVDTIMSDQNEIICDDEAGVMSDDNNNNDNSDNGHQEQHDRDFFISMIMKDSILYRRRVLNLSWNREKQYTLYLPEACDKACWGSPYGWIVTLGLDRHMELLNPLTKARLPLPSQRTVDYPWSEATGKTIRTFNIDRAVLLQTMPTDIDNDPWLVVLFHRTYSVVSFARTRDKSWKKIHFPKKPYDKIKMDVMYNRDLNSLLFVDAIGNLHYYVIHDAQHVSHKHSVLGPLEIYQSSVTINLLRRNPTIYVVQSGGDLLILLKIQKRKSKEKFDYKTTSFRVYKLINSATHDWEEQHDLNGAALFVGNNVTFSIPLAHEAGIRSNCVYYNDDVRLTYCCEYPDKLGGRDMGVYDLVERSIQPLTLNHYNDTRSSYCCPLWFSPAVI